MFTSHHMIAQVPVKKHLSDTWVNNSNAYDKSTKSKQRQRGYYSKQPLRVRIEPATIVNLGIGRCLDITPVSSGKVRKVT